MTSSDASIGDVEDVLNNWNLSYSTNPSVEGRYIVNTEAYIEGWNLWHTIPAMATFFAGMTADHIIEILPNIGTIIEKIKTHANSKVSYKFSATASAHMSEKSRQVPITILDEVIKNPKAIQSDPQQTMGKYMYYSTMYKNQQLYNVEVLYSPSKNKIYHFLYNKKAMGPLPAIKP